MMSNFIQKLKYISLFFLAIGIGIFSSYLLLKSNPTKSAEGVNIDKKTIISAAEETPKYFYSIKDKAKTPRVSAFSYLVGDLDTGEIILAKNEEERFPLASVSKLMTAVVASEITNQESVATVSKQARSTYGSNGGLKIGEKIKVNDLFYPLLLESSNDAGEVIAEYFNRDIFIKKMNQMAAKLDLSKTLFEDPSGLSPQNQSSAKDMFKLAGYIKKEKPELLQITTKRNYSNIKHNWFSNNQFLREEGYMGGKSGYTEPAKETVVSLFSIPVNRSSTISNKEKSQTNNVPPITETRNIAITLLQSKDRFKDVENILKYLKSNVYYGGPLDVETNWVAEKKDIPEVFDQDFVTLLFGGDIMLDRGVRNSVNKNWNGDYSALFEKSKELSALFKKSDITFANLEGPASDVGKDRRNLYSFRMDPSTIPALKGAGLSIVSVANNHVGDWGRDAYLDTLKRLRENEISYTGGGINATEAEKPVIIEKYGMKIGFLGFSDVGPEWMKAWTASEDSLLRGVSQAGESDLPTGRQGDSDLEKDEFSPVANTTGLLLANNPRFDEIVGNASKQVDYLVVSFHFGEEYKTIHNLRQEYLAHKAIDAGAKIVVGHHPHVIQDTEVYGNGFIAYSLGNFIFDQSFSVNTMQGMLLEIKLERDGKISVKKNVVKLNKFFQPEKIIFGKEEKIKFEE